MKKFCAAFVALISCFILAFGAGCKTEKEEKKPEKLKDGTSLTLTEGESKSIDLSEYISVEGTDYAYTVKSSDTAVATVTVSGNTATVVGVKEGSAQITASADAAEVNFAVTVNKKAVQPEEKPAPVFDDVSVAYDLKDASSKEVTIAPKSGSDTFEYTYALKEQDSGVTVSGAKITVAYGEACQKQLTVVASYTDRENAAAGVKKVEFKLNVNVSDTRVTEDPNAKYKAANGSFDSDLDGWTAEGDIGAISEVGTFWEQNLPIHNVGKYFAGDEAATGKLKSSLFEVGGINKITFMLGAAGNKDCYITLEKADGTILAIWRNAKFNDIGTGWDAEEIGKTQFANNLVTYVADLTEYAGESVRVVLNDNATSGFGFINFDELVTYYAASEDLPENATAAVNELADKSALSAALENVIEEQGDYTQESFAAYTEKVTAAQAVLGKVSATQTEADEAKTALETAYAALTLRAPSEKPDAEKSFVLFVGKSKEITIADYVDENNLSAITYEVAAADASVTVSGIESGKFTVTAGAEAAETTVTLTVKYKGETKLTVTLDITVTSETAPSLKQQAVAKDIDLYTAENKTQITLDFAGNVNNAGELELTYEVKQGDSVLELSEENTYTYTFSGEYSETATAVVFTVKICYSANGTDGDISYTYTLNIKDTTGYRVVNGDFDHGTEENGLYGWTAEGDIGEISENDKFWEDKPMFNVGKYFRGESKEGNKGTLASSAFKVGGINKITFMLGAAGNKDCYITLEKADGTVLAIWRNAKFNDIGTGWDAEEIGKTQFACNLVTYVADLTEYAGQEVRVVLHDHATGGFGFINFDELVTYYAASEDLPENATAAVNELADKSALSAALENVIEEQGDYTQESFAAYTEKVTAAQAVLGKASATQTEVDTAVSELESARTALAPRAPEEVENAEKTLVIFVGKSKEITIADYVDENNLSAITYEVAAADAKVTVSGIESGKFTVTAGAEAAETTVTLTVKYKGETKLTVTLNITVTSQSAPTLKDSAVSVNVDLHTAENKTQMTLDFAGNVNNAGELELTYEVKQGENVLELSAENTYMYDFDGEYSETATEIVFNVKISFTVNGEADNLSYTFTLSIKDTRAYRIVNGDFDHGTEENGYLDGWTLSNADLGAVNEQATYWDENVPFNNVGKFFNAYATNKESAMGTLTSSSFKIGGVGWITYKLGGTKNSDKVYLDIIEKDTGAILARYYNNAFSDDNTQTIVRGCTLIAYKADLSAHIGKTVYIRLSDNAEGDYGLFFLDSVETYYETEPQVTNTATPVDHPVNIKTGTTTSKYQVYNGGFENGLEGWTCVNGAVPGDVSSANRYWGKDYNNVGKLFTAVEGHAEDTPRDPNLEDRMGTIRSETFTLKANAWISFRLGGAMYDTLGIRIVKTDGTVLASFYNTNPDDGRLIEYKFHFDNVEEVECYIEIFDNEPNPKENARGWRLVVVDEIVTDLDAEPENGIAAKNQVA